MNSLTDFLKDRLSGADIKQIREILNISQDKLGRIIGVTAMAVYGWERGTIKVSEKNQAKILTMINDFLGYDETQEKRQ